MKLCNNIMTFLGVSYINIYSNNNNIYKLCVIVSLFVLIKGG